MGGNILVYEQYVLTAAATFSFALQRLLAIERTSLCSLVKLQSELIEHMRILCQL
jgi:hypothetical protein